MPVNKCQCHRQDFDIRFLRRYITECSRVLQVCAGCSRKMVLKLCITLLAIFAAVISERVDYTGHKVFSVVPRHEDEVNLLLKLRTDYGVDLWNEPQALENPVMVHLPPHLINAVEKAFHTHGIEYEVVFQDLQSIILAEQMMNAPTNASQAGQFDFGKYNEYNDLMNLLKNLAAGNPNIAKLEVAGHSYENLPIYNLKISSGASETKPAIMMECGIHAREWSSVAACAYFVNRLITTYGSDPVVKSLVDKYEFNIIIEANPDGYIYTWQVNRLWRKTRSRSSLDWLGVCRGADANRNFDIEHCGVGTSRKPCDDIYCGDKPFSESESRTLRDLMTKLSSRMKLYVSVHAYSQLWMTPYGISKKLPDNYGELKRVADAGVQALARKYGTQYRVGSIANIIYEAAGSSVDYAYVNQNIKMAFALELRDTGRHGFFLPTAQILPMCEETYDGLIAAIQTL